MTLHRFCFLVLISSALLLNTKVQASSPDKVLFVGNSFSFYNNGIHNHYNSLIRANGDWQRSKNRTRLYTLSGGHFHEHLSGLKAYLAEDKRGWDAVVLQGHSNESVLDRKKERFKESLSNAIQIVEENKMQPIVFMTWGYKGDTAMAKAVADAYIAEAQKHKVKVVPVGLAFAEAEKLLPHIELFVPDVLGVEQTENGPKITYKRDWKHPSVAGTYLAACVFYASLQSKSPEGNLFHASLSPDVAEKLQKLSWQIVSDFKQGRNNEDNS